MVILVLNHSSIYLFIIFFLNKVILLHIFKCFFSVILSSTYYDEWLCHIGTTIGDSDSKIYSIKMRHQIMVVGMQ